MSAKFVLTLFAATACAAAALAVPAQATPRAPLPATPSPDCDWTRFATDSDLDQGNGSVVHIEWGMQGGSAAVGDWKGGIEGPVIVKGTNEIDFSVPFARRTGDFGVDVEREKAVYRGSIDPNGAASGTWHNEINGASGTWTMTKTFNCIGNKPAEAQPPGPGEKPVRCVGGRMLPPGSDCGATPAPEAPEEKPPTDAIRMTITKQGFSVKVVVTNSADIAGQCTYDASEASGIVPAVNRPFDIAPKGTTELSFPAPLPTQSWRVVVACSGDFNGKNVEFGRQVQTVNG